jgi:3'-phosphoadenosine 5'-phosphosulfate sulfotransferase
LRNGEDLVRGDISDVRNIALDDVLGHVSSLVAAISRLAILFRAEILRHQRGNSHCCRLAVYWGQ